MDQKFSRGRLIGETVASPPAPAAPAEPVRSGVDMTKIAAIPAALQSYIDRGDIAGIVSLTVRHGELIQVNTLGWRDLEARAPMQRDTLFRLASMTKPVTSAAVMMLVDEGKLKLSDPVTRWLPELANRRVLRQVDGPLTDTVPAHRDITVEDLLTHRAGFGYGFTAYGPIGPAYTAAIGASVNLEQTTDEWLAALGTLPLFYQPGERIYYGASTDVLGFLLERIDQKSLEDSLRARIFAPLGMNDTSFWIPEAKRERLAMLYQFNQEKGALETVPDAALVTASAISAPPPAFSGGGGLFSTAEDYLAFARLLRDGGTYGGARLLKPETVRRMRTNHLTAVQRQDLFIGLPVWDGMGFGLGLATVEKRLETNVSNGSVGSYGWPGAYGTWWQNDPVEDLTMIYMIQQTYPLTPDAGAVLAEGRGVAHREALPTFERMTYEAVGSPPPDTR